MAHPARVKLGLREPLAQGEGEDRRHRERDLARALLRRASVQGAAAPPWMVGFDE